MPGKVIVKRDWSWIFWTVVFWVMMAFPVVLALFLIGGVIASLFEPPPTVAEYQEQIDCLDYVAEHEAVAQALVIKVHADVLQQLEPQATSAERQVGDAVIGYGGYWSPNGIPEGMWDRIFSVESEDLNCRFYVNSMYANVEGDGMGNLLAATRAWLVRDMEEARERATNP